MADASADLALLQNAIVDAVIRIASDPRSWYTIGPSGRAAAVPMMVERKNEWL